MRKRSEVDNERARGKRRLREDDEGERAARVAKKRVQVVQERGRSSEREAADDEDGEFLCAHLAVWFAIMLRWVAEELPVKPLPKSLKKRRDATAKNIDREREVVEDVDAPQPQPQPAGRGKKSKRTFGGEY